MGDGGENVGCVAGEERAAVRGEVVEFGVGGGRADGVRGEFDACDGVKVR